MFKEVEENFLEKIVQEILHDHHISISIGGRLICNLRRADDTDLMGHSNGELQDLNNRHGIWSGSQHTHTQKARS